MISLNNPRSEEKKWRNIFKTPVRHLCQILIHHVQRAWFNEVIYGGRKCDPIISILKAGLPDFLTFSKSFYLS